MALVLTATLFRAPAIAQDAPPPVERAPLTRADAAPALDRVKADPNLRGERRIRTLRWIQDDEPRQASGWFEWLTGLFRWLGQTARILVWVTAALVAGLLAYALVRLIQSAEATHLQEPARTLPTHVRELDIRPESLPDDIGAAARRLWDAGDHRAALALLYRGLLSRLVHVHAVPIRASSTEGDCLSLAAVHAPTGAQAYVHTLVRTWQRAVYGGQVIDTSAVHTLCDDFASALPKAAAVGHSFPRPSTVQP